MFRDFLFQPFPADATCLPRFGLSLKPQKENDLVFSRFFLLWLGAVNSPLLQDGQSLPVAAVVVFTEGPKDPPI